MAEATADLRKSMAQIELEDLFEQGSQRVSIEKFPDREGMNKKIGEKPGQFRLRYTGIATPVKYAAKWVT